MGLFDRFKKTENASAEAEDEKQNNNQDKLKDTAINETDIDVRKDAIDKITDDDILESIVKEADEPEIALYAYRNIKGSYYKSSSIHSINNDELLIEILESENDEQLISAAVSRISSKNLLNDLFEEKRYNKKFIKPILGNSSFSNEDALADIAQNNASAEIRCLAVENPNFNSQEILKSLANDNNDSVSLAAISKITDEEFLKEVLKNRKDDYYDIVPELKNEKVLAGILNEGYDGKLKRETVDYINDEDILLDIAKGAYGKNDIMQAKALEKIKNQNYLETLAYNSNIVISQQAVRHISDKKILENIIADTPNPRVRELAIQCRDKL